MEEDKPLFIVVMGASGCGKTTVGLKLGQKLHLKFLDADSLHPTENVSKMRSGIPLTDEDRLCWLQTISNRISEAAAHESVSTSSPFRKGLVIGCSSLKLKYRNILRGFSLTYEMDSQPPPESEKSKRIMNFLHLKGSYDTLLERIKLRKGHFMPATLLRSQLNTLETPTTEEFIDQNGKVRGKLVTISIDENDDPNMIVSSFLQEVAK